MISKEDIEHLKDLARVEFGEQETDALAEDMGAILGYMDNLKDADISNATELTHASDTTNIMRGDYLAEDKKSNYEIEFDAVMSGTAPKVIENFPEREEAFLKVKNIF